MEGRETWVGRERHSSSRAEPEEGQRPICEHQWKQTAGFQSTSREKWGEEAGESSNSMWSSPLRPVKVMEAPGGMGADGRIENVMWFDPHCANVDSVTETARLLTTSCRHRRTSDLTRSALQRREHCMCDPHAEKKESWRDTDLHAHGLEHVEFGGDVGVVCAPLGEERRVDLHHARPARALADLSAHRLPLRALRARPQRDLQAVVQAHEVVDAALRVLMQLRAQVQARLRLAVLVAQHVHRLPRRRNHVVAAHSAHHHVVAARV
eukprot:3232416-Rhodomonas_salina.2